MLKVALVQAKAVPNDQEANLAIGEQYCRKAAAMGADIALFPEMWNIGHAPCPPDPQSKIAWQSQAVGADSSFINHFKQLAKELKMAIAITYLPEFSELPYERRGEV